MVGMAWGGGERTFNASLTKVSGVAAAQTRFCYTGPCPEHKAENHAKRDVVEDDTSNDAKGKPTARKFLINKTPPLSNKPIRRELTCNVRNWAIVLKKSGATTRPLRTANDSSPTILGATHSILLLLKRENMLLEGKSFCSPAEFFNTIGR
jgi:hypothetical protein